MLIRRVLPTVKTPWPTACMYASCAVFAPLWIRSWSLILINPLIWTVAEEPGVKTPLTISLASAPDESQALLLIRTLLLEASYAKSASAPISEVLVQ